MTPTHRAYLALLLAAIDGDDERAHAVIAATDPVRLAHYVAHRLVHIFDEGEHPQMRSDLEAELHGGA